MTPGEGPTSTWVGLRPSRARSLRVGAAVVGGVTLAAVLAYTLPGRLTGRDPDTTERLSRMEPEAKRAAERRLAWSFVDVSGYKVSTVSPTRGGWKLFVQSNADAAHGDGYRGGCDSCFEVYVSRDGSTVTVEDASGGK